MTKWNVGFYNNLSSIIPSTLEAEIEYVLNREAKPTMPRSYIEGYLNAVAYTYDRSAYEFYREPAQAAYDDFAVFVDHKMDQHFKNVAPSFVAQE
mgnify:CR=1 FL=1|tara:strand:- start:114 stop:398 length:285 start_codon:yes stop_codon:yes gene_type:complete